MLDLWKRQFAISKFKVEHHNPLLFISSQWQNELGFNVYYFTYRFLVTLFFLITLFLSTGNLNSLAQSPSPSQRAKWFIYLTNWGYTICTLQSLFSAILMLLYSSKKFTRNNDENGEKNTYCSFYKIYWITNITATDIAFAITIIYWSVIYDAKTTVTPVNIIFHVINSVLMLLDLFIVAHPVRILHFYWSVLFGTCYILFTIIYYFVGGTNRQGKSFIYPILNWTEPGKITIICIALLIFLIILHCFVYGAYLLRKLKLINFFNNYVTEERTATITSKSTSTQGVSYNSSVFVV